MAREERAPGERRRIGSVGVGFRLVRALEAGGRPMSLTELAKATGMPSSQAHLYLVSFAEEGLVWQDPSTSHYQLGPYAIQLGVAAIRATDVLTFTKDALLSLVRETGDSSYASIWTEYGPVIVQKIDGARLIPVSIRVGHVMPLLTSATGRVFLAYMPRTQTRAIVARELAGRQAPRGRPDPSIATESDVDDLVAAIRDVGLAQTDSLLYAGFLGISVPILNHDGEICCSLTTMGPQGAFDPSTESLAAEALRRHAADLCQRLGWRETPLEPLAKPPRTVRRPPAKAASK
jgi:DNA-binding IclR family transcriptional regulator